MMVPSLSCCVFAALRNYAEYMAGELRDCAVRCIEMTRQSLRLITSDWLPSGKLSLTQPQVCILTSIRSRLLSSAAIRDSRFFESARLLSTLLDPQALNTQLNDVKQVLTEALDDVTSAASRLRYVVTATSELSEENLDDVMLQATNDVR